MKEEFKNKVYTIGYGTRSFNEFVNIVKQFDIQYVVDIRSNPFSKFNPVFSKNFISKGLRENNIGYVDIGEQLGGKPTDKAFYKKDRVDYSELCKASFYLQGISRLKNALEKNYTIVLMCSELKPQYCHRSKLIGQTLIENEINVEHIDEKNNLISQKQVIDLLNKGQSSFLELTFTSRKMSR